MTTSYLRPNTLNRRITFYLICGMFLISIFLFGIQRNYAIRANDVVSNQLIFEYFEDTLLRILSILMVFVYLLAIIWYVRWFVRAYHNLEQLNISLPFSKTWAGIGWFIPVLHWIIPVIIMSHMNRKTVDILHTHDLTNKKKSRSVALIIWWTLYVLNGLFAYYVNFHVADNLTIDDSATDYFRFAFFLSLVNLSLTFYALLVINNYGKLEDLLWSLPNVQKDKKNTTDLIDAEISNVNDTSF